MRARLTEREKARNEMKIQCPTPETLGCGDFKCSMDHQTCDTDCMDEIVVCAMCSGLERCTNPIKDLMLYKHKAEKTKAELLSKHDKLQDEILEIYKYYDGLKLRQKWAVKEQLKDLNGQLKGLRMALYKLDMPFTLKYRTGMKIEGKMEEFWERQKAAKADA